MLTRGITSTQLQSSLLWYSEPQWLTTCENWPVWQPSTALHLQAAAISTSGFVPVTNSPVRHGLHQIMDISNYSTLCKVVGVTAIVLQFVSNLKNKLNQKSGPLTAAELMNEAKMKWVKDCQQLSYLPEITYLMKKHQKCPTLIRQL